MIGHYQDLESKTFLVTGASSGIGRAVAVALGAQKARVIATGRDQERLDETLAQVGGDSMALPCDLRSPAARAELVEALPALDGICHAAGIIDPFPIRFLDQARFEKIFAINATAPILLTSALLGRKKLKADASIVFISSAASSHGMKGGSLYSATKAALEAFSRAIVLEHATQRIRSNCLKPAMVRTPLYERAAELWIMDGLAKAEARQPLGLGTPEDVASATLIMDGGMTAGT